MLYYDRRSDADGLIFAPGVADLLQALGPGTTLRYMGVGGVGGSENYMVTTPIASLFGKTAIEALSRAWLFINEGNPADRDEF